MSKPTYPNPLRCTRCEQQLDSARVVWLELDTNTGKYHRPETFPEDGLSQGGFPFGSACAERAATDPDDDPDAGLNAAPESSSLTHPMLGPVQPERVEALHRAAGDLLDDARAVLDLVESEGRDTGLGGPFSDLRDGLDALSEAMIHLRVKAERDRLRAALARITEDAPTEEPTYEDWGGDTERAEVWGGNQEHWRCAQIAREALGAEA